MAATTLPTWIEDKNPYLLPEPPEWALKALYDFDAQLVIVPSRQSKTYLLCRRRLNSAGMGGMVMTTPRPDTQLLYDHGLVDVAPLKWPGAWTTLFMQRLLGELKARDIWTSGGPESFVKIIEDHEATAEIKKRRDMRDEFRHRAGDAWRSLQARTGQRNHR